MSSTRDLWKSPAWPFQSKEDALYDLTGTSLTSGQSIAVEDAETATVTDVLLLKHTSSGTPAAGFGTGLSFQGEDGSGNGAEEWASIDAVAVTVTAGSEDADLVFSIKDDGTVKEVARFVGDTPRLKLVTADAGTTAVSDMLVLSHSTSGTAGTGFGSGISFELEDASGNAAQEAASIDVAWTTATHASEAADLIFSISQAGSVAEIARFVAADDVLNVLGGYKFGSGGTVTQASSITTGVTLNTFNGEIVTVTAPSIAAGAEATFTVTNSKVAVTDHVLVTVNDQFTDGLVVAFVSALAAGSFDITLSNVSAAAVSAGTAKLNFAVFKGTAA